MSITSPTPTTETEHNMTTLKTPEQIAREIVSDNTAPDEWSPVLMGEIRGLITAAIEADRAQRSHPGELLMADTGKVISLTIVETIHYGATFTVGQLNEMCMRHGVAPYDPDGETGDLTAWLQDEASSALRLEDVASGLLSEIEHDSCEVQEQDWEWSF